MSFFEQQMVVQLTRKFSVIMELKYSSLCSQKPFVDPVQFSSQPISVKIHFNKILPRISKTNLECISQKHK